VVFYLFVGALCFIRKRAVKVLIVNPSADIISGYFLIFNYGMQAADGVLKLPDVSRPGK
jgi:hypothetical protein